MKHLLYISFLFISVAAFSQSKYAILKIPQCWTTPTAVDSSVNRVVLVTTQTSTPTTLYYTNADNATINVSGGSLSFGYCDCCGDGSPGTSGVIAFNGLTQTGDTIKFGGVIVENTSIDGGGYNFDWTNSDTLTITAEVLQIIGGTRLQFNSLYFPRNDGFDGQALRYDASGDSLEWYTPSSANIYNADGTQTDQIRTNTLAGKTLVLDGETGEADTSTILRLKADFSTDDAKTTFISMEMSNSLGTEDSLIIYDYDNSFIGYTTSSIGWSGAIRSSLSGYLDSLHFYVGFAGGSGTGAFFQDLRTAPRGLQYAADYSATYTDRSLIDKGYLDIELSNVLNGPISNRLIPFGSVSGQLDQDTMLYFSSSNELTIRRAASTTISAIKIGRSSGPGGTLMQANPFSINYVGGDQYSITANQLLFDVSTGSIRFLDPINLSGSNSFRTANNRLAGLVTEINTSGTRIPQWKFSENSAIDNSSPFIVGFATRSVPNGISPNFPALNLSGVILNSTMTADTASATLSAVSITPTFVENSQSNVITKGISYNPTNPATTHYAATFSSGLIGIGTVTPTSSVDIVGVAGYNQLRLRTTYTPTSTADANGNIGDVSWDDDYIYIKTSAGWKRTALSTF